MEIGQLSAKLDFKADTFSRIWLVAVYNSAAQKNELIKHEANDFMLCPCCTVSLSGQGGRGGSKPSTSSALTLRPANLDQPLCPKRGSVTFLSDYWWLICQKMR